MYEFWQTLRDILQCEMVVKMGTIGVKRHLMKKFFLVLYFNFHRVRFAVIGSRSLRHFQSPIFCILENQISFLPSRKII